MKLFLIALALGCLSASLHLPGKKGTLHTVKMEGMKFIPKVVEIKAGDKVQWINASGHAHNVVANDGSFRSSMLHERGQVFEFTFTTAGTFAYYCQPHKLMGMKGVIVVK